MFDTLIKTLAMLREQLRSSKPLRFALWLPTLSTSRVFGSEYRTRKTGFYCLNIYLTLQFFVRFSTSLRFGRIYFKVHLHPDVKFWYRILISRVGFWWPASDRAWILRHFRLCGCKTWVTNHLISTEGQKQYLTAWMHAVFGKFTSIALKKFKVMGYCSNYSGTRLLSTEN